MATKMFPLITARDGYETVVLTEPDSRLAFCGQFLQPLGQG